jgi:hypothetical protein
MTPPHKLNEIFVTLGQSWHDYSRKLTDLILEKFFESAGITLAQVRLDLTGKEVNR